MKLKELRTQLNIPLTEMANILEISKGSYWSLESGETIMSIKNALKIANHFHVSLDYIYSDYITAEDREQGVVDFTQIVVNAGEYDVVSIYRAIGEKLGKGGQDAYREFGNTLLEKVRNN